MSNEPNPTPPPMPWGSQPRRKTIEEIAAEQGVKPIQNLEEIMGSGTDLWETDEEFEEFLRWLRESRRGGREP